MHNKTCEHCVRNSERGCVVLMAEKSRTPPCFLAADADVLIESAIKILDERFPEGHYPCFVGIEEIRKILRRCLQDGENLPMP